METRAAVAEGSRKLEGIFQKLSAIAIEGAGIATLSHADCVLSPPMR
jgi:hypothetical protein